MSELEVHFLDGDAVVIPSVRAYGLKPGWFVAFKDDGTVELFPSDNIDMI